MFLQFSYAAFMVVILLQTYIYSAFHNVLRDYKHL